MKVQSLYSIIILIWPFHLIAQENEPLWWTETPSQNPVVVSSQSAVRNNLLMINRGQFRHFVHGMMNSIINNNDSQIVNDLFSSMTVPGYIPGTEAVSEGPKDFHPITQGEAKNVLEKIYYYLNSRAGSSWVKQQLVRAGLDGVALDQKHRSSNGFYYPWTQLSSDDNHLAPLNIGQLKLMGSMWFDESYDGDDISDYLEMSAYGNLEIENSDVSIGNDFQIPFIYTNQILRPRLNFELPSFIFEGEPAVIRLPSFQSENIQQSLEIEFQVSGPGSIDENKTILAGATPGTMEVRATNQFGLDSTFSIDVIADPLATVGAYPHENLRDHLKTNQDVDIFVNYPEYNPNCWAAFLDFTGVSWGRPNTRTAITRRHVVRAKHFPDDGSGVAEFVSANGEIVEVEIGPWTNIAGHDVAIATTSEPIPDSVHVYSLPEPFPESVPLDLLIGKTFVSTSWSRDDLQPDPSGLRKASVRTLSEINIPIFGPLGFSRDLLLPKEVFLELVESDSGNPAFLLDSDTNELILATTWHGGGGGAGPWYGDEDLQSKILAYIQSTVPTEYLRTKRIH